MAIEDETMESQMRSSSASQSASMTQKRPPGVSCEVVVIGSRPAGELQPGARILQVIRAVDAQLSNAAQVQLRVPVDSFDDRQVTLGGGS